MQPSGVGVLQISIMNVHDEVLCVHLPELTEVILGVVREGVEHFRPQVPLIGMDWCRGALNWAEKHGSFDVVKIRAKDMK